MAEEIGNIRAILTLQSAQFIKATEGAMKSLHKMQRTFGNVFKAVAAAASVGLVVNQLMKASAAIDEAAKASDRLGLSLPTFRAWTMAAEDAGIKSQQFASSVQKMSKGILDAETAGKGPAADALKQLSLSSETLSRMGTEQQMIAIAGAMEGIGSQAQRARISAMLFGEEAGPRMSLLLAKGQKGLEDAKKEAAALGMTLSRVDAAKVEEANAAMGNISKVAFSFWEHLMVKLAPALTYAADLVLDWIKGMGGLGSAADSALGFVHRGIGFILDAGQGLRMLWEGLIVGLSQIGILGLTAINNVAKAFQAIQNTFNNISGVLSAFGDLVKVAFENPFGALKVALGAFLESVLSTIQGMLERIEQVMFDAGLDTISDNMLAGIKRIERTRGMLRQSLMQGSGAEEVVAAAEKVKAAATKGWDANVTGIGFVNEAIKSLESESKEAVDTFNLLKEAGPASEQWAAYTAQITAAADARARLTLGQRGIDESGTPAAPDPESDPIVAAEVQRQSIISEVWRKGLEERTEMSDWHWTQQASHAISQVESITRGVANSSKAMFRINQIAGIADATINTARGVTQALAAYPPPLSFAMAGLQAAAGVAQINAIRSTSFGGGGGSRAPSTAGSGGGIPAQTGPNADGTGPGDRSGKNAPGKLVIPADRLISGRDLAEMVNEAGRQGFIFDGVAAS